MFTSISEPSQHRADSIHRSGMFCPCNEPSRATPLRAGYGRCSQCACQAYQGTGQICANCGHNYSTHW
jgi:hypothetical protein